MSEKWQLTRKNRKAILKCLTRSVRRRRLPGVTTLMSLALAIGIVLTWITWDPKVVICCMVLSILRLGALFCEYPELQLWRIESQSDSYMSHAQRSTPSHTRNGRNDVE